MEGRELRGKAAITGLGISEMGRVYGHDAQHFAAEAIQRAVADTGLRKDDIDGLRLRAGDFNQRAETREHDHGNVAV